MARRWPLALALVLTVSGPLAGCVGGSGPTEPDVPGAVQVLTASDRFSYVDAARGEQGWHTWNHSFEVHGGTSELALAYTVDLSASGTADAPSQVRHVEVWVRAPNGTILRDGLNETGAGSWRFDEPGSGTWTVGYRARGEGLVSFLGMGFRVDAGEAPD